MTIQVSDIVGTWALRSCVSVLPDGSVQHFYGTAPIGVILYTAAGWMSCHMAFGGEVPADGVADDMVSYSSYHGPFSIDSDDWLIHHVQGATITGMIGTDQRRHCRLDGDHLLLSADTGRSKVAVGWQRVADRPS